METEDEDKKAMLDALELISRGINTGTIRGFIFFGWNEGKKFISTEKGAVWPSGDHLLYMQAKLQYYIDDYLEDVNVSQFEPRALNVVEEEKEE